MFVGMTSERSQSQASLPPLDSPYLVNASSRSISFMKSPSPSERAQVYKLQEQLKNYQDEISRKDKLIDQLSKIELKNYPEKYLETKLSSSRTVCIEREEVAALNVKLDNLRTELSETTCELQQKETLVESMKRINCELREEIARLQVALGNTSKEINEFGEAKEAFETMRQRNNILISSLENELRESQQNLMDNKVYSKELEDHISEITEAKNDLQRQIEELKNSLTEATSEEVYNISEVINRIKTLIFENESSKNKIQSYEEKLKSRDCEQQASRQTITRLVVKLSAEETKNANNDEKITNLKREIDQYKMSKTIIEADINSYECQISSLQKEIELLNKDNETKAKRIQEISTTAKINQQTDEQQAVINQFINSLIGLLSENYKTPKNDSLTIFEWIIGCVKSLLQNKNDVSCMPQSPLNETIDGLKSDLIAIEKLNSKTSSENEPPQLKLTVDDLNSRLKMVEAELVNASVVIDGLNCDKIKYFRILSELARVMNMNEINKDIGFDMISEALYARAVQLQKLEYDSKTDHRLAEHSLNRKIKELKEKLHSKDLHIDLLHKKLASSEGKQQNMEMIGKERDKELSSNKKLAKHNQKLQEEVENLRSEVIELKGSLINYNKLQVNSLAMEQELKCMTSKVDKLEGIRQKQSKILNDFKASKNNNDKEFNEMKANSEDTIASLSNELKLVKESLNDCKRKEQQMIEMRAVVAKLLGLDLDNLAIPDFEIINRLERLITAHQSNIYTQYSMDRTLQDMNQGFFHDPCIIHTHHTHIVDEEPIYPKSMLNQ